MNKVSIVVPVYNAESTLEECIESVLGQTYQNIELILINDGSKDFSLAVCEKYAKKDSRILLINNENHGVSYTRNMGIDVASGEFITFLDSDDYLEKDMISKMVESQMQNDADLIQCNLLYFDTKHSYIQYSNMENILGSCDISSIRKAILSIHYLNYYCAGKYGPVRCIGGKLYKLSILKKHSIRFSEELYILEDGIFNFEYYSYVQKANFMNLPLYCYRQHSSSTTYRYNPDQLRQYDLILEKFQQLRGDLEYQLPYYLNCFELLSTYIFREYKYKRLKYREFKKMVQELFLNETYQNTISFLTYQNFGIKEKIKLFCLKKQWMYPLYLLVWLRGLKKS